MTPTYDLNVRVITPKPKPLQPLLNIMQPFTTNLWIALVISLLVIIVTKSVMDKVAIPKVNIDFQDTAFNALALMLGNSKY